MISTCAPANQSQETMACVDIFFFSFILYRPHYISQVMLFKNGGSSFTYFSIKNGKLDITKRVLSKFYALYKLVHATKDSQNQQH